MSLPEIHVCPGTLANGFSTYSPLCLRKLFFNKRVSHLLPFESPQLNENVLALFMENMKHISISGVQQKLSLIQQKNTLRLTHSNEQGTHILKPIPAFLKKANMVPANAHLTMQIAKQIYGIQTAENAMLFFKDGTAAYITQRFDLLEDGSKLRKEDFATLAGKSKANATENFKYEFSYEEIALLIQKYVPAWRVEMPKYFSLVVFNYLFSNGDAHLKNFSLLENAQGDFLLSPAYDLLNSRMHVDDSDFALSGGLFADDFKSVYYKRTGHACKEDFFVFGKRIGLNDKSIDKLLQPFFEMHPMLEDLISRSFLSEASKRGYLLNYQTKRNYLNAL
jgi:serine/threonine-protein kinase HipA